MIKYENISEIIKDNLIYYRKHANLTQLQLAEKLNYSDKSISKWERGEGIPDIYVFMQLAKLYGLSVNDFLTAKKKSRIAHYYISKVLIMLLSVASIWLLTVIAFAVLKMVLPDMSISWQPWLLFIYAIPASFLALIIEEGIFYRNTIFGIILYSLLLWTFILSLFLSFPNIPNIKLLWTIAVPLQAIIIVVFLLVKKVKSKGI